MKNKSEIIVRNMVCPRCVDAVDSILKSLGLSGRVELGHVDLVEIPSADVFQELEKQLVASGFEIVSDDAAELVEKVKLELIQMVFYGKNNKEISLSAYLQKSLGKNYSFISREFSNSAGTTIQEYYISLKVERAKELIRYGSKNYSEIADDMGYRSLAYFTYQFKKSTGMTPTQYKNSSAPRNFISSL